MATGSAAATHRQASAALRPHIRYLDGLRGVAILAVLMIHSGQLVHGLSQPVRDATFYGVRGVQLFFIVSGYTLTLNHFGKPLRALNFAARRFFRIAPMFYLGALLYLLLSAATDMALPTRDASALDIVATLLFLHGWLPSAINTVVPGGWSIAAEAMFYLSFPVLLLVARHRRLGLAVLGSYVVAGATNIVLRHWLTSPAGQTLAFSFWLVQLPAFAGGCWLATLPPRPHRQGVARIVLAATILALIGDSQLRGHSNLLVAVALLTLLVWSAGIVRPALLEGRVLPLVGEISFSLYILQFAVLGLLAPLAAAIEGRAGAAVALPATFLAALSITAPLAFVTYRWIERPIIAATRRIGMQRP